MPDLHELLLMIFNAIGTAAMWIIGGIVLTLVVGAIIETFGRRKHENHNPWG